MRTKVPGRREGRVAPRASRCVSRRPPGAEYLYHHSRHDWNQDRSREREARARGYEFRRYTYDDVTEDRVLVEAELCDLLPQANVDPE